MMGIRTNEILTLSDIEHLHYKLDDGSIAADIRFPAGGKVSVAAAIELASILLSTKSATLYELVDKQLSECEIWTLFRRLRGGIINRTGGNGTVLMRIPYQFSEQWLSLEMRRFETSLSDARFPRDLGRSITGAVFEMVDNVWVHSLTQEPSLFCYQIRTRKLTFGVMDMGKGVLNTLRENRKFSHIRTSMNALEEAVKRGVSGQANGSGLGLDSLTRALANLWGKTRLRTGQAALTFDREQQLPKQLKQFLPEMEGFQISAICRLDRPK